MSVKESPRQVLTNIARQLSSLYGQRLRHVVLHGSRATGQSAEQSDIDVIVVLDTVGRYWDELERTAALVADLSLDAGATINVSFVSEEAWEAQESSFLRQARSNGLAA